jgi:hypothetical protein
MERDEMSRERWLETQAGWQRDRDAHGALCPKGWNLRQLRSETAEEEIERIEAEIWQLEGQVEDEADAGERGEMADGWEDGIVLLNDHIGELAELVHALKAGLVTVIPERDPADAWNRNEARLTEDRVRAWLSTEEQRAKRSKLAKRKLQAKGIRT